MPNKQPLAELVREFTSSIGEYLTDRAAAAVDRILSRPLRRAAKKAALLGLSFGLTFTAAIMLALSFFNMWMDLFGGRKSLAYLATFGVCLVLGVLCAWVVFKDGQTAHDEPGDGDGRATGPPVATDQDEAGRVDATGDPSQTPD